MPRSCLQAGFRSRQVFRVEPSGTLFEAHRLLYHSTLGLRVIKKKRSTLFWYWEHGFVPGFFLIHCKNNCTRYTHNDSTRFLASDSARATTPRATPHRGLRRGFRWLSHRKSVTLSIGTPLCPYPIAYRRAYGLSIRWTGSKNLRSPLCGGIFQITLEVDDPEALR